MVIKINSYTENDLEMESFIRIPMAFIDDEFYEKIKDSTEAMVIYGLFDRRLRLSRINKKNWTDKNGLVYIIYTVDELSKKLKKSRPVISKAKKILAELGLITEVRQGLQKTNLIYPQKVRSKKSLLQEVKNIDFLGSKKSLLQEVKNIDPSKKDISEIDISNKDTSNPDNNNNTNIIYSAFEREFGRLLSPMEIEEVGYMIKDNPEELVLEALREAVLQHKPTIRYIKGILKNWRVDKLTTVEMVRAHQEKRASRNKPKDSNFEYDEQYNFEAIARGER